MIPGLKSRSRRVLDPAVSALVAWRVHPNTLTLVGLGAAVVAGLVVARGSLRGGAVWLLVSGLFDVLDGGVARRIGRPTARGAFLDSTLDRYAEGAFLLGLAWYASARAGSIALLLAVLSVLLGSLLVSYTRARAEGLGTTCTVGLMERPERFGAIILICLLGGVALVPLLWILSVLIHGTAVHRIVHVYNKLP
jgi:phosphatidylglycerophosphate synthase